MSCGCNLRKRIIKQKIDIDNKRDVYLDYNSTTKPDFEVIAKVDKINRNLWGNPSSQNSRGSILYKEIENSLTNFMDKINCTDLTPYFDTSSSSIINTINNNYSGDIITSKIEHTSLLSNSSIKINVDCNGKLIVTELEKILKEKKKNSLLIYSPVNHETGSLQSYKDIYNVAKKYEVPVILDAVQLISKIHISQWLKYCDGFYFSAHKIYGLQGSALLMIKNGIINFNTENSPLPFSLYKGTFNTPASLGLIYAAEKLIKNFNNTYKELSTLHTEAMNILSKLGDNIRFESPKNSVPGIINISCPGIYDIETLLLELSRHGIQISRLSACSGDIKEDSYVLKEMGRDKSSYQKSLRISFGLESKRDDFFRLSSTLKDILSSSNV